MRKSLLLVLGFLVVSCMPAVKPELIDKMNTIIKNSTKNKTYRAGGRFRKPRTPSQGQFVMHKMVQDGKLSITRVSLIKKQRRGWIIETYSIDGHSEAVSQMLISGYAKAQRSGDPDVLDILWIKVKGEDGEISTIEGPQLVFMKNVYLNVLDGIAMKISRKRRGGRVKVPAGIFSHTVKQKSKVELFGSEYMSTTWYNSFVPISGVVKSVSEDGGTVIELLDFGLSGAKSRM